MVVASLQLQPQRAAGVGSWSKLGSVGFGGCTLTPSASASALCTCRVRRAGNEEVAGRPAGRLAGANRLLLTLWRWRWPWLCLLPGVSSFLALNYKLNLWSMEYWWWGSTASSFKKLAKRRSIRTTGIGLESHASVDVNEVVLAVQVVLLAPCSLHSAANPTYD